MKQEIAKQAFLLGFSAFGIASADYDPVGHNKYLRWLDKGYQADMHYLERDVRRRFDPRVTLPSAKSVIVCALNYYHKADSDPTRPYISIYARGENYHSIMVDKLKALCRKIEELAGHRAFRVYADSSPISEKWFAARAGLGFIGRNGLLIIRSKKEQAKGSFIFLGSIITDLELAPDAMFQGTCGQCKRCIESCPTGAIVGDGTIKAARCISYQTTQNKGIVPDEIAAKMGNIIFGCDICQAVCPYNANAKETDEPRLISNPLLISPEIEALSNLSEEQFNSCFGNSSLGEKGYALFKRNMGIAIENIQHLPKRKFLSGKSGL